MSKASPFFHTQIFQISLGEGDQGQTHIPFLFQGSSSSSKTPCPLLLETQKVNIPHEEKVFSPENKDVDQPKQAKWMSSKMRIMKKMMSSDQTTASKPRIISQQQEKNSSKILPGGIVRVCSDCNTTKTPLWRSGPQGPKSLCNACGIRQRKARRSMSTLLSATNSRAAREDRTVPFKKRCRFISTGVSSQRKLCFEDVTASLKRATVFPQDEKDAAILLMALSCGLICS